MCFQSSLHSRTQRWNIEIHTMSKLFLLSNVSVTLSVPIFTNSWGDRLFWTKWKWSNSWGNLAIFRAGKPAVWDEEEALICGACWFLGCKYSYHDQLYISQILTTELKLWNFYKTYGQLQHTNGYMIWYSAREVVMILV